MIIFQGSDMDKIHIRKCLSGKHFVAAADSSFEALKDQKCPFCKHEFETAVSLVDINRAEIQGINYQKVVEEIKDKRLSFEKFKIDLAATVILD